MVGARQASRPASGITLDPSRDPVRHAILGRQETGERFHVQSVTGAHDERVGNGGTVTACWVRAGGAEIFAGEWRMETSLWFEHSPGGWVTNNARITIDSECGHGRIVVAVDSIFTHLIHKDDILY